MMIFALLLALTQEPQLLPGPVDWAALTPLPWRNEPLASVDLAGFAAEEVHAGRCALPSRATIDLDVAVFVRADGLIRATVPRAINCPTVEQFAAGLVSRFARNNLRLPAAGWYRATISFEWGR